MWRYSKGQYLRNRQPSNKTDKQLAILSYFVVFLVVFWSWRYHGWRWRSITKVTYDIAITMYQAWELNIKANVSKGIYKSFHNLR